MNKKKWLALTLACIAGYVAYNWTDFKTAASGLSCENLALLIMEQDFNKNADSASRLIHVAEIKTIEHKLPVVTCHGVGVFGDTLDAEITFGVEVKFDEQFFYFRGR